MAILPIPYSGKTKRSIIEGAYEFCGLNGFEFERTPEEMTSALDKLNDMMAEWEEDGIVLGYDHPEYGSGNLATASGIPDSAVSAVKLKLALRIAPALGATLSPEAKAEINTTWTRLQSRHATVPTVESLRVSRGAGYKRRHVHYVKRTLIEGGTVTDNTIDPGDLAGIVSS